MLVEMKVAGLAVDPSSNMPVVLLQDEAKEKTLPIWIGIFEASAIATQLEKIRIVRPMTHDLLKGLLDGLGGVLQKVEIPEVRESTFYANLVVRPAAGGEIRIDCRPSDAIALALRCGAPILVESTLVDMTAEKGKAMEIHQPARSTEEWEELLKNMSEEAFGKYKM